MLERDRNRDGMLDPDELEKDGPAKFDTPDRNHSGTPSRRNWDDCGLSLIFSAGDPAPTAQLGRVIIHAQIAGPLSGQTGKHLLILSLSASDPKDGVIGRQLVDS